MDASDNTINEDTTYLDWLYASFQSAGRAQRNILELLFTFTAFDLLLLVFSQTNAQLPFFHLQML